MMKVPNTYRLRTGPLATEDSDGNNGAFKVPVGTKYATVVASDGAGWEHVSVSFPDHIPTWPEMCKIKEFFWDDEDAVIQIHPPVSEYVNYMPNCLHLWRSTRRKMPMPHSGLVGPRQGKKKQYPQSGNPIT